MGAPFIVPFPEFGQASSTMRGMIIHPPVDLLLLQRPVKPLQQSQLGRRPVLDPDVTIAAPGVLTEAAGDERGAVVRHHDGRLFQRPVDSFRLA